MGKHILLAGCAACILQVAPAFAQEVLMRRPLPSYRADIPSTVTPTPTPAPTPTPTGPKVPDDQGLDDDPDAPTPVVGTPPATSFGSYTWKVGDWQGAATCGQASVMTRSVSCQYDYYDYQARKSGVMTVPDSMCVDDWMAGDKPASRYTGEGARCKYEPKRVTVGEWKVEPDRYGGVQLASCSSNAYRDIQYACVRQDGVEVSMSYCTQGLSEDGQRAQLQLVERGNYEGCTYKWVPWGTGDFCATSPDGAQQGPNLYANVQYVCRRSDGMWWTKDDVKSVACPVSDRPFDGVQKVGTCHSQYETGYWACMEEGNEVVSRFRGTYADGGSDACKAAGATCCQMRGRIDVDEPYTETIGTKGQKTYMWYFSFYDDAGHRYAQNSGGGLEWRADQQMNWTENGSVYR